MILLRGQTYDLSDPRVLAGLGAVVLGLLVLTLLIVMTRRAGASARATQDLATAMGGMVARVETLAGTQQQLAGGLTAVTEAQIKGQARTVQLMEQRLSAVTETLNRQIGLSARAQARSLGELQERLKVIDTAQDNITRLSGDVLSLQDILSNKQARGAFGEIQLEAIVSKALPPDAYTLQATLTNGRRADCLVHLPQPPGPIAIDSKFPLEPYEALLAAEGEPAKRAAARDFRTAVRAHMKAIAERYIVEGETGDGALMFLPSEAVYAELHAHFGDVVREGFALRVWIVSPTTCMATLNTMRAVLKDARLRQQAGAIRAALGLLYRDVALIEDRAARLETHLRQAGDDVAGLRTAAARAGKRAERLDNVDFADWSPEPELEPELEREPEYEPEPASRAEPVAKPVAGPENLGVVPLSRSGP